MESVDGERTPDNREYLVPGAIVVAGLLIAGAVIYAGGRGGNSVTSPESFENALSEAAKKARPVGEGEHIRGSGDAKVTIIEYADFECPYCESFHPEVKRIVDESAGEVRWVYRHFPLSNIHPIATGAAIASECAASLGGNDVFWRYTDELFARQFELSYELLFSVAKELGIEEGTFAKCLDDPAMETIVNADFENALDAGGNGTPFTIIENEKGERYPIRGALDYDGLKRFVDEALAS